MVAEALFERIDARGFRGATLRLTDTAIAHGFAAVIPERLELTVGYGRGERSRADTLRVIVRGSLAELAQRASYGSRETRTARGDLVEGRDQKLTAVALAAGA